MRKASVKNAFYNLFSCARDKLVDRCFCRGVHVLSIATGLATVYAAASVVDDGDELEPRGGFGATI